MIENIRLPDHLVLLPVQNTWEKGYMWQHWSGVLYRTRKKERAAEAKILSTGKTLAEVLIFISVQVTPTDVHFACSDGGVFEELLPPIPQCHKSRTVPESSHHNRSVSRVLFMQGPS